ITVDPGHGGSDPGAVGPSDYTEAECVLDIGLRLRDLLEASNAEVLMTRETDVYVSLEERVNIANDGGADIYVSIHNNAYDGNTKGIESYYYEELPPDSEAAQLTTRLQEELIAEIDSPDRGVKTANYYVLRETWMPASLTENMFIDNPEEEAKLMDPEVRQRIAEAHYRAICDHFGEDPEPPGEPEFVLNDWSVDPGSVNPGETVMVEGEVENIGDAEGEVSVDLYINDDFEDSTSPNPYISPGESEWISFSVSRDAVGSYDVDVHAFNMVDGEPEYPAHDSWSGSFEVVEETEYELTIGAEDGGTTDPAPGTYTYTEGEEVTVEAFADQGWYFVEWTGDVSSTSKEITVTMDSDKSITAHFEMIEHELTIYVDGEGTTDPAPDTYTYPEGEKVTVEAFADQGWYFAEWTGDHSGTAKEIEITMDSDKVLNAHFDEAEEDQCVLSIYVDGEGTTEPEPGDHTYQQGTEVQVEAFAEGGWKFSEWSGDVPAEQQGEQNITVNMDGDRSIAAHFEKVEKEYELTVEAEVGGTTEPEPGTHTYNEGEKVEVEAFSDEGRYFVEWTGDHEGTEKKVSLTMDRNKSLTAHFSELEENESVLTIYVEGEGSTEPGKGVHVYDEGSEVTVTATPEEGWEFSHWEGDVSEEEESENITLMLDEDKEVTAHFEEEVVEYELSIESTDGGGVVEPGEGVFVFEEGETVELEAVPEEGYGFVGWTGDVDHLEDPDGNQTSIEISASHNITAEFEVLGTYSLAIEVDGEGRVKVDPDQDVYEAGSEVTLTAEPHGGWYFVEWTGDLSGDEETKEVTMDDDKEITAHFSRSEIGLEIVDHPEEVTKGEEIVVEYALTNVDGDGRIVEFVVYDEEGEIVYEAEEAVPSSAGERYEGEFVWQPDEEGEYELEVKSLSEHDGVMVAVEGEEEGPISSKGVALPVIIIVVVVAAAVLIGVLLARREGEEEDEYPKEGRF
ncbi:MAG: InlB B-repeat-containing protein, partial [Candidatus Natronoplasma sp.]